MLIFPFCAQADAICKSAEMKIPDSIPPPRINDDNVSNCSPSDGKSACSSVVVSSLPSTINWLRNYAKENPSFRIQVNNPETELRNALLALTVVTVYIRLCFASYDF